MFRRRHRYRPIKRLRQLLWPSRGWWRTISYLFHRVRRLPDSPYSIAAGFACGAAVSVTPIVGFHFAVAALFAWAIRGNLLASAFGTIIGNPWTFPLIFLWTYHLGNRMLGEIGPQALPEELSLTFILDHPWRVLLPTAVGSLPTAAAVWAASFWAVRLAVVGYRRARRLRLQARPGRRRPPLAPESGR
ncbi:MAG: DUF2062 domain-containing protein [Dongiaceae bacterium]